jgi:MoxR-like ATPase
MSEKFSAQGTPEQEKMVFVRTSFVAKKDRNGRIVRFTSSAPDRKEIRLLAPEGGIQEGVQYDVEIFEDSNPGDPKSGYYTARISDKPAAAGASQSMVEIDQWKAAEVAVDEAETSWRLGASARRERKFSGNTDTSTIEEGYEEAAEAQLGEPDSLARVMREFRREAWARARAQMSTMYQERAQLLQQEAELLSSLEADRRSGVLGRVKNKKLQEVRSALDKNYRAEKEIASSSPEAFYAMHMWQLSKYREQLQDGRIVETPYVRERMDDIEAHVRAGVPVLIYGHLGSGKTELAMHIARSRFKKDAIVISGSKHTAQSELYGHQILTIESLKTEDVDQYLREVEGRYSAWLKEKKSYLRGLTEHEREGEKNRAHDRIVEAYMAQFKSGTISKFFLGPIYRAMQEGKIIIIDEVNAIPHEVLISLNHILTRKAGDKVSVQQNSGSEVTVAEGYGVLLTGNLNQGDDRYVDRQDMDPAFLSRQYKVEYDYLPQPIEGSMNEASEQSELFHLEIAKFLDRMTNVELPIGASRKLWDLARAARVTQDVFAGKDLQGFYFTQPGVSASVKYTLQEAVLSLRALDKVLSRWQSDGFRYELDYYLYTEFVSQSTRPSDRAYLYQIFKDRFDFFKSPGWEQSPNYGKAGVVSSFSVAVPKNQGPKTEFLTPRKVVNMAFGKAPDRKEWPIHKSAEGAPVVITEPKEAESDRELIPGDYEGIRLVTEILGKENVLGPAAVEEAFGVKLQEVPVIPFSRAELQEAAKLKQMLVLRIDKTKEGKPMNMDEISKVFRGRFSNDPQGGVLATPEGWRLFVGGEAFSKDVPRAGWALVSKELIPGSTGKNYLEQTNLLLDYIFFKVFRSGPVPEIYAVALGEFNDEYEALKKLLSTDPLEAARRLSELKITKLSRHSLVEAVYDVSLRMDATGQRSLAFSDTLTSTRAQNGDFVHIGNFSSRGLSGNARNPGNVSDFVGVLFSRRI